MVIKATSQRKRRLRKNKINNLSFKSSYRRQCAKFTPPKEGQDWVLVIDDASKKFNPPGNL